MKYWASAGRAYSQRGDYGVNETPDLGLRRRLRPAFSDKHFLLCKRTCNIEGIVCAVGNYRVVIIRSSS